MHYTYITAVMHCGDYMMRKGVKIGYVICLLHKPVQAVNHNNITYLHF